MSMELRQELQNGSFDFLNLSQLGKVILPNRAEYEKRINNVLACVKAIGLSFTFSVNDDYVTIALV